MLENAVDIATVLADHQMELIDLVFSNDVGRFGDRLGLLVRDLGRSIGDQDEHASGIGAERLAGGQDEPVEGALGCVTPAVSYQFRPTSRPNSA